MYPNCYSPNAWLFRTAVTLTLPYPAAVDRHTNCCVCQYSWQLCTDRHKLLSVSTVDSCVLTHTNSHSMSYCRNTTVHHLHTCEIRRHQYTGHVPSQVSQYLIQSKPVPGAARSKASACGRSLAGTAGSNPTWGMDVCCECCVLSGRGLCEGADHSSTGVLPTVVCRCVWSRNLVNEEALAYWRLSRQK